MTSGWGGRNFAPPTHMVRGSTKDLHLFRTIAPLESPKIMGLWGIHSLEALKQQMGLSFCPWCGKEGQNDGTIVNHLCTRHYCPGLVSKRCLLYFTTTSDKMQCHTQGYPCMPSHKDNGDGEVEKFN